ncbi:hypothetical protein GCM10011519_14850 [Marmoricola endophyticus]|uniref:Helicase XPB/Ssl2 N-terminal domain-containing protein n=1 Tax=Marmoricola endophyticus TaxID=2040280 RepID=A0A917F2K1_9ACTN|nr:helicase C-terminal domain-containing protein [Marmoricola endophyticus]GGF42053.1 hypothetical protein GCM10011519_14850 [Marmoricola endophyticus]
MPSAAPRTLADQLRGWSDERLGALLLARPDVAVPTPHDSAQLAARLSTRPSVLRALDGLTRLDLTVLEAVLHLAPTGSPTVADVVHAAPEAVGDALERLGDLTLVWGEPLRPVSVLGELLGVVQGASSDDAAELREGLSEPARAMLDHLDHEDAGGRTDTVSPVLRELLDARLVAWRGEDRRQVVLPWSVRVGLRGGRSTREDVDVPPPLETLDRPAQRVDRAAAGAAFELVRRTDLLLDHWGTTPPAVLRSGGLGVRDLRAVADLLQVSPTEAGLVVETAAAAGLLAVGATDEVDPAWLPTDAYDTWQEQPAADRWALLARAWLASPRMASLVGGRDEQDRPVNALTPELARGWLPALRHEALTELAGAEGGLAGEDGLTSLVARMRWRHPRRPTTRADAVRAVLEEAALVGITGRDALASPGRALGAGDDAAAALAPLLPEPVDHVLLQADLTAVAPGPLETALARSLGLLADVESRGGATTYRFTAASIRRAFDAGWSAGEVKDLLAAASRTDVPQALDYLVDDVSRRFGTLRAGVASAFLRSDDEAALSELLHRGTSLGLRRIAPTVLVSDTPLDVLLPRLRELGAAPVVEAADGTVRVARPDVHRARRRRRDHDAEPAEPQLDGSRLGVLVGAVRAGDRLAASRPAGQRATSPGDVLRLLRQSAEDGEQVRIGYVDNHGTHAERVVDPLRIDDGRLVAHDQRARETRTFAIHRIAEATRLG